ncbi:MAG TPA: transaldolase [Steroidobacteraceae bacterium]|nr:transaldolase [Steroidobacteraceae bacterium]
MPKIDELRVKLFADGADESEMLEMSSRPFVKGLTTNPTLMRMAGVVHYQSFATRILARIRDKPVSLEVLADDLPAMEREALAIASWGDNVYVKVPVTNTKGQPTYSIVERLASRGVKLNVTAIMTLAQVRDVASVLNPEVKSYVSVLAGRIADTGVDPEPMMAAAVHLLAPNVHAELIWGSPRELLNIFHAERVGCHAITLTREILRKLPMVGRSLEQYSLDTVRMFRDDATTAGYSV